MPYLRAKAGMARTWSDGGGVATARVSARAMARSRNPSQRVDAAHAVLFFVTKLRLPFAHTASSTFRLITIKGEHLRIVRARRGRVTEIQVHTERTRTVRHIHKKHPY